MVKSICRDVIFLAQRSLPATAEDVQTAQDLLDTLSAHRDGCVGMAANMIGVNKRIIVFDDNGRLSLMFNPEIINAVEPYEAEEGCLSLTGTRRTRRWKKIKVRYDTPEMQSRLKTYSGWTAQIIQHEIDHLNGILI